MIFDPLHIGETRPAHFPRQIVDPEIRIPGAMVHDFHQELLTVGGESQGAIEPGLDDGLDLLAASIVPTHGTGNTFTLPSIDENTILGARERRPAASKVLEILGDGDRIPGRATPTQVERVSPEIVLPHVQKETGRVPHPGVRLDERSDL